MCPVCNGILVEARMCPKCGGEMADAGERPIFTARTVRIWNLILFCRRKQHVFTYTLVKTALMKKPLKLQ